MLTPLRALAHRAGRAYLRVVVAGRWVVVALWVALAAALTAWVPTGAASSGASFSDLLPADTPSLQVEQRALREFRVPLLTGTTVVVHQAGGLSLLTRADAALWAVATTQDSLAGRTPHAKDHLIAAIPVPTPSREAFVTYLYTSPGTGLHASVRLARQYAAHFDNQAGVRADVTGFTPAQVAQSGYLSARLPLFEAASVLLIILVVSLVFRSVLTPLVVLVVAGTGYLVYFPILSVVAGALGVGVPSQLEPVLVALLLGVVTDYCVLFFSTFRDQLASAPSARGAATAAVRLDGPVVAVAGLTVAGGTISLLASPFGVFKALGPALALTVVVGLAASLTLTPALMAILGRHLFPGRAARVHRGSEREASGDRPGRLVSVLTTRIGAAPAALVVVAVLGLACAPLAAARLDLSFTASLPSEDSVARGGQALADAGVRGMSAPTEVLVEQRGVIHQRAALARFQALVGRQPGVALVLGPAQDPTGTAHGAVLARSGDAARLAVVVDSDPLGATAIAHVRRLQSRAPALAVRAGLPRARVSVTGQTLIASRIAQLTRRSLYLTLLTALVVELVILVVYLRALVAPVALLACSALGVGASLGVTTLVFQGLLHQDGLTFYAPFATAVLLLALGSDYNVFAVGSIWQEARRSPLRRALRIAVPRTSAAITTAGFILAATFAVVAVIPLTTFRQIAFTMTLGVLLDTLVVRPVLTPAVLTLLGRAAGWPGRRTAITERSPTRA